MVTSRRAPSDLSVKQIFSNLHSSERKTVVLHSEVHLSINVFRPRTARQRIRRGETKTPFSERQIQSPFAERRREQRSLAVPWKHERRFPSPRRTLKPARRKEKPLRP